MSRQASLDASPPVYRGSQTILDKHAFRKELTVLAARAPAAKTGRILKSDVMRRYIMDLPRIRSVVTNPSDPTGDKLLLLRVADEDELPSEQLDYLKLESRGFEKYSIHLDYNYWTADEILQTFLPEELRDGSPTGFAVIGHIAHLNLNEEYLPYKHIIGQIILDKNKRIRTVVNKLDTIHHQFRFFKMDLIAGEPDFVVEHHESDCRFTFDFTQVYWNSRLHTEHERLVQLFSPEDVVVDVFAGVGPFSIPAAVKGCSVLANDLNPESAKYLSKNVVDNRVSELVRVFCEDGRDFIRQAARRCRDNPFPPYLGHRPSRMKEKEARRKQQAAPTVGAAGHNKGTKSSPLRRSISHFVMNLPDSAISFLDAFRGILSIHDGQPLSGLYDALPMIHCHCFTRELDPTKAEVDIRQRVEEKLGCSISEDVHLHLVRSVAPNKNMYCISFRLPAEVAYT